MNKSIDTIGQMILNIGIDDTDSEVFGCTTYVAARIVSLLDSKPGVVFLDYPLLIRLNPNIPWKTRGNGAVSIRISFDESRISYGTLVESILDTVRSLSDLSSPRSEPAVTLSKRLPERNDLLHRFYLKVLRSMVTPEEALRVALDTGVECRFLKTSKVGVVGALAAVGAIFDDYTFELLVYRVKENYGKPRRIDAESVYAMDKATSDSTFNNVDPETQRILIAPHGRDPVLFGIRGETPEAVYRAFTIVRADEDVELWGIFKTNQGTDAHFPEKPVAINQLRKYDSTLVIGKVVSKRVITGGHVIITLSDGKADIPCAVFSPTGRLKKVALMIEPGDIIKVCGGVKEHEGSLTLNVEKIEVLSLSEKTERRPPLCPVCGKRSKSRGLRQGFQCEKCGITLLKPELVKIERNLEVGVPYLPSPRAHRHLTKPLKRYGREKYRFQAAYGFINPWHFP
ncbi:MAG: TiaS agmantine-binding domain-containing protein [Thermoproteota archaeon]